MKEYTYQMEHSWEKQRRAMPLDRAHRRVLRHRYSGNDADASSISGKYKHISLSRFVDDRRSVRCLFETQLFAGQLIITYVPVNDLIISKGKREKNGPVRLLR